MPCTTILVGAKASYDGSTMIARNSDSGSNAPLEKKKFIIFNPQDQPRLYRSVLSKVEIPLPENPMRISATPNAVGADVRGLWSCCGVNEANVAMTATETITSNERVDAADPLVIYDPAHPDVPGGIGEEDMVNIVLPFIRSAREGVMRLGALLEQYGTYERNGIAFSDRDEIWWLETIGGHHWMARRVPDDCYAVIPNQLGIDCLDLEDAMGAQKDFMCSADLRQFVESNHLDLATEEGDKALLDTRLAFGSHSDADHSYNTPRAWYMLRYFNPRSMVWDGPDADYAPTDDDLPWCMTPERKITPEDVKYILSSHFQGTPYDAYATHGDMSRRNMYRSIGINRTETLSMVQIRPDLPDACRALQWVAFGPNAFNAIAPFYPNVSKTPDYLACVQGRVTTDSWYWASRVISALADASWATSRYIIERYAFAVQSKTRRVILETDEKIRALAEAGKAEQAERGKAAQSAGDVRPEDPAQPVLEEANGQVARILREEADRVLEEVLEEATACMTNHYDRADV